MTEHNLQGNFHEKQFILNKSDHSGTSKQSFQLQIPFSTNETQFKFQSLQDFPPSPFPIKVIHDSAKRLIVKRFHRCPAELSDFLGDNR
jgi:hypothetical protein